MYWASQEVVTEVAMVGAEPHSCGPVTQQPVWRIGTSRSGFHRLRIRHADSYHFPWKFTILLLLILACRATIVNHPVWQSWRIRFAFKLKTLVYKDFTTQVTRQWTYRDWPWLQVNSHVKPIKTNYVWTSLLNIVINPPDKAVQNILGRSAVVNGTGHHH